MFPIEVEQWEENLLEENRPASSVKINTIPAAASIARTESLWAMLKATDLLLLSVFVMHCYGSGYPILSSAMDILHLICLLDMLSLVSLFLLHCRIN